MSIIILEEYVETGNFQDLDMLLSKQPELLGEITSHDVSPLLLACYYRKNQIVDIILKYLKNISVHEVCALGYLEQLELMVDQKPNIVNEISTNGFSPLGIAAHFGNESVVRLLLRHHADPNIASQNGYHVFPIHAALSANDTAITKLLIEAGAEVNVIQHGSITPLHLAAQHGNIDIIIILLEHGVDISVRSDQGLTAADIAFDKGFKEIGEILSL
ncbi:ankyrin repeat domain-containing protein [Sphingobacterium sp. lm-10]|uniref:ankyrin repeat domain-containing protein n=1 Tax=Sphingobacterium sp. lm-10 TaxID=2944904 RepID=UPI0020210EC4|nr:ankyrin repeat domain-containing protein [Sphingobacterium sp. lm-10]MCL7987378.1 ankyrin repeat domain-containing protein [Sphingobacterium sp. lm-10]